MLRGQHIEAVAYFVEFLGFQQNFVGWHKLRGLLSTFKEAGPALINAVSTFARIILTAGAPHVCSYWTTISRALITTPERQK
jgi:hypothetical protein